MSNMSDPDSDLTVTNNDGDKDEDLIEDISSHIIYEENKEFFPGTISRNISIGYYHHTVLVAPEESNWMVNGAHVLLFRVHLNWIA